MDNKTIFDKTPKGEQELRSVPASIPENVRRALLMVDGISSFGEINKRVAPSLRRNLAEMFETLEKGGFIVDRTRSVSIPKMTMPTKMSIPPGKRAEEGHVELDFTSALHAPTPETKTAGPAKAQAEKLKAEAETKVQAGAAAKTGQETEAAKLLAQQEAEAARHKAEQEAARVRAELEAAMAKAEAEAKAKQQAESVRLKAEQEAAKAREEAELAKRQAAAEAKAREEAERRVREEAEAARKKAEQEAAQARAELEAARAAAEAEAKSRKAAEQRAREEAEAVRKKTEQEAAQVRAELEAARAAAEAEARSRKAAEQRAREEAEALRKKAEQEAAQARAELEAARAAAEAEAKSRKAAEQRAREEAEALRKKAEQESAHVRAELEAARAAAEAEAKSRKEAEQRAKEEAEALRNKAEQESARVRAELEAARIAAEAEAKSGKEVEQRAREEAEAARKKAEQAAAQARAELEAARAAAEAHAKSGKEAERRVKEETEAALKKAEQAAAQARAELEAAKVAAESEAKSRKESELRVREEVEAARLKAEQAAAQARAELEAARAAAEAHAKSGKEAERRVKEEAEAALKKAEQAAAQARAELEAARAAAEAEAKSRKEAEQRAREEAEAVRKKAEQEAAQIRAEWEAAKAAAEAQAKAGEESARRAREEAEAAHRKAEQEAAKVREEAARLKAEVDAKYEAEAGRQKAEREAAQARKEAELARQKASKEAEAREQAEERAQRAAAAAESLKTQQESEAMLLKSAQDVALETSKQKPISDSAARSTSATVLFFDVVGYTKLPVNKQIEIKKQFNHLVSDCLRTQEEGERIILDTGDGAAIGFLQHPEDALEVAMKFRKTLVDNYTDYPDLKVRMGIHLGPINVVKDMTGRSNMVGDGINDAQRVMSFAETNQIYVSRPYYDFVSRLTDEYADLFRYRGSQIDKHGREHQLYELVDVEEPVAEAALLHPGKPAEAIKLEPFNIALPEARVPPAPVAKPEEPEAGPEEIELMSDIGKLKIPGKARQAVAEQKQPTPSVKPAPEARMPSGEEVAKFAAEQSRTWTDAERRAMEAAKAKAERDVQSLKGKKQEAEDGKPALMTQYSGLVSRLSWGKAGAGLFVLLLILLLVVPYVLPTQGYATKIEQQLTARLQNPAHIGHMAVRLLPAPHFNLSDVSLGEANQVHAQQARVNFAWSALFTSNKPINSIELDGVQVNGAALQQVSGWLQQIVADTQHPIARIGLNQGKLEADNFQLSGVGGELSFNQAGKFSRAKLHAEENKYALDIDATPENKLQVSIKVRDSALPLLPNWTFNELSAKGELTGDELVITELFGNIMGGILRGDARIGWRSGWHAQGKLVTQAFTLGNISKMMGGDMDAEAKFEMRSASFSKLTETATLNGTFVIKDGVINRVDIVETARLRSKENLAGGRTHFDELAGVLSYANEAYHFSQIKINAGVLNATGAVDIVNQKLSGRILADLSRHAGIGIVTLQVGGTVDNPTLRAGR